MTPPGAMSIVTAKPGKNTVFIGPDDCALVGRPLELHHGKGGQGHNKAKDP